MARLLEQPLSSLHARLERLLEAGTVEVAGLQARAGRPVRRYRVLLPWCIPVEVNRAATLRELLGGSFELSLGEQLDQLARVMGQAEGPWEVVLGSQDGELEQNIRPRQRTGAGQLGPVVGAGVSLRLSPSRARILKERLDALLMAFREHPDEGGEAWTLTALLTPGETRA